MKFMRSVATPIIILAALNCRLLLFALGLHGTAATAGYLCAALLFMLAHSIEKNGMEKRLRILNSGVRLLISYLIATPVTIVLSIWALFAYTSHTLPLGVLITHCILALLGSGVLFLSGGLRVFITSSQLGVKWRLAALCLWWLPPAGYLLGWRACWVARAEFRFERAKRKLKERRRIGEICKTRYPILLVHGVFFRDSRYFNYWGRIPRALTSNGAAVYYGQQQSAASVKECGRELAQRIESIVRETGCERINVIAHSKGGLDMRSAIHCENAAPMVASLTTINTPHRGCEFAEWLLHIAPQGLKEKLASGYNKSLRRLGDHDPDFLGAVGDLTASSCLARNEQVTDSPDVYYQSVGSFLRKARGGRFPLNLSHHLVKLFDGANDGLVSTDSAKWGAQFTLLEPAGRRGISHADVIDLGRENIRGFDVCEFYVDLLRDLKERGF